MSCRVDALTYHTWQVDALTVKMNRSLYDPRDTRSLRDEILDLKANHAFVAAEILCPTRSVRLSSVIISDHQ